MRRWLPTAALALLLSACTSTGETPTDEPTPDATDADSGKADEPPVLPTKVNDYRSWLQSWRQVQDDLAAEEARTVGASFHKGKQLQVQAVKVGDRLPAPETPASEVLIVIEGSGALELSDGSLRLLSPGCVALLPAGARKSLSVADGQLQALMLRSLLPGTGEVQILDADEILPLRLVESKGGTQVHQVGELPGALSVHTVSIGGLREREVHLDREEFLLVISGWGTLGLGAEGSARYFGSQPLRENGMVFIPAGAPHSYRNESEKTLLLIVRGKGGELHEDSYSVNDRGEVGPSLGLRAQIKKPDEKKD